MEGWGYKQRRRRVLALVWQRRYFRISVSPGGDALEWLDKPSSKAPLGSIPVSSITRLAPPDAAESAGSDEPARLYGAWVLHLFTEGRVYRLMWESEANRDAWLLALWRSVDQARCVLHASLMNLPGVRAATLPRAFGSSSSTSASAPPFTVVLDDSGHGIGGGSQGGGSSGAAAVPSNGGDANGGGGAVVTFAPLASSSRGKSFSGNTDATSPQLRGSSGPPGGFAVDWRDDEEADSILEGRGAPPVAGGGGVFSLFGSRSNAAAGAEQPRTRSLSSAAPPRGGRGGGPPPRGGGRGGGVARGGGASGVEMQMRGRGRGGLRGGRGGAPLSRGGPQRGRGGSRGGGGAGGGGLRKPLMEDESDSDDDSASDDDDSDDSDSDDDADKKGCACSIM